MTTTAQNPLASPATLEARGLTRFASAAAYRRTKGTAQVRDATSLWRLDAIHRAENLAQLSKSLTNVSRGPVNGWPGARAAAPAAALARTYAMLSLDSASSTPIPCFSLVADTTVQLAQIFGRARRIVVHVSGNEVEATVEQARALALMSNELVINALKHTFPSGGPGRIAVRFEQAASRIELVVTDDGEGVVGGHIPGHGNGLIKRLARVCGAVLVRSTSSGGHGLCITVSIPSRLYHHESTVDAS